MLEKKKLENMQNDFRQEVMNVKLDNLIYLKDLGEGQFGDVCLVTTTQDNNKFYALKSISRAKIAEHNIDNNLVSEKKVLELVNFPLIIKLYNTYKD